MSARANPEPGPAERREAPCYLVDARPLASIDGRTDVLLNISRSGVALRAHGLTTGSLHALEFNLNRHHLAATIKIRDASDEGLLRACFIDPRPHTLDLVAEYIQSPG